MKRESTSFASWRLSAKPAALFSFRRCRVVEMPVKTGVADCASQLDLAVHRVYWCTIKPPSTPQRQRAACWSLLSYR